MTWAAFVLLAALAVMPVLLTLRRPQVAQHRRPAALALYRAQLGEIDRDLIDGRIVAAEHAAAALEVQRRLLAAAAVAEPVAASPGRREPLVLAVVMVMAAAVGLYALDGRPELPSGEAHPATLQASLTPGGQAGDERARLQQMIDNVDTVADATRQDQVEQGDRAERRGDLASAAAAWGQALAVRFDPLLAVRTADAESKVAGHIGFHAATLFRRALAAVPSDAPWREMAERRLAEAESP